MPPPPGNRSSPPPSDAGDWQRQGVHVLESLRRLEEHKTGHNQSMQALGLLRHKPNAEMTAFPFKQTLMFHALMHGNGYAWIDRVGNGSPAELIPLVPGCDSTFPVRENGKLFYVTHVGGNAREQACASN